MLSYYDNHNDTCKEDFQDFSNEQSDECFYFNRILINPEPCEDLLSSPYILSQSLMQEIGTRGLPPSVRGMVWKRLYSINRDGDAFLIFLDKVRDAQKTLMVVRTDCGCIFGGFADCTWEKQKKSNQRNYFGTGQSFLFSVKETDDDQNCLNIFRWAGQNYYNQICDADAGRIAMGGDGHGFGLCLQDSFTRGTTEYCETFHNEPLVKKGFFEVVEFEVFGFFVHASYIS